MEADWTELAEIAAREAEDEMDYFSHQMEMEASRREAVKIADAYPHDTTWHRVVEWLGL